MSKQKDELHWFQRLAIVALEVLRDNDGEMRLSELMQSVEKREGALIPDEAKDRYDNGLVKWMARVQFLCNRFVQAGLLEKKKGVWRLTDDGEEKAKKPHDLAECLKSSHKSDNAARVSVNRSADDENPSDDVLAQQKDWSDVAREDIEKYISSLHWERFQSLCAALVRGMNYHVRDVALPGPDGGIDVLAYTDPLGGRPPRLKVQVKHHQAGKIGKPELSQLAGLLTDGDIGVFISSGGFAKGCRDFARNNSKHLELIDLPRFIDLWQMHYNDLSEEDKALLPLQSVYFLDKKRAVRE